VVNTQAQMTRLFIGQSNRIAIICCYKQWLAGEFLSRKATLVRNPYETDSALNEKPPPRSCKDLYGNVKSLRKEVDSCFAEVKEAVAWRAQEQRQEQDRRAAR
jgi:hypothetical protein